MALFDKNLLFYHTGSVYGFTAGEFMTVAGTTSGSSGLQINLGTPRDLGIGDGAERPSINLVVGTAFTSSCSSLLINAQFQGSTSGAAGTWTTFAESGPLPTSSYSAGLRVLPITIPRRPDGIALPQYYQVNLAYQYAGGAGGVTTPVALLSTGTLIGGISGALPEGVSLGQYPSGFTVV